MWYATAAHGSAAVVSWFPIVASASLAAILPELSDLRAVAVGLAMMAPVTPRCRHTVLPRRPLRAAVGSFGSDLGWRKDSLQPLPPVVVFSLLAFTVSNN